MSTDTENGPVRTDTEAERIAEKLKQIKTWAAEKGIRPDEVVAAFSSGIEQPPPPNHTSLAWFDIHRPDGGKLHVVVRAGATRGSVLDTVFTASNAFGDLVEQGWMPADRRPRTQEEIAETKARLEEKLDKPAGAKRKKADGNGRQDVEGSTRTIQVENILKRVTDSGNLNYLIKGHPWSKYGVTAWPDSGQVGKLALLVDMDAWKVGELIDFTDDDIQAVVRLKLKEGTDKLIPDKVVDFLGDDALPDVPEDYDDGS